MNLVLESSQRISQTREGGRQRREEQGFYGTRRRLNPREGSPVAIIRYRDSRGAQEDGPDVTGTFQGNYRKGGE